MIQPAIRTNPDRQAEEARFEAYRRSALPKQLEATERKLAGLRREAERLGMSYLLDGSARPAKTTVPYAVRRREECKSLGWTKNLGAVRHERAAGQ